MSPAPAPRRLTVRFPAAALAAVLASCFTFTAGRSWAADSPSASEPIEPLPPAPPPSAPPVPSDVSEIPASAKKTASGLASRVLTKGTGTAHPGPSDHVTVDYTGWTTDGKMFDSSVTRGVPAKFPLDQVIKGWTEGVQLMVKGEKRRFWIPAALA